MWLRARTFDIVSHPQPREKTCKDGEEEIDLDKELEVFLLEGSKIDL